MLYRPTANAGAPDRDITLGEGGVLKLQFVRLGLLHGQPATADSVD